ncbi:MAG: FIST C-terminal domain-containing protein [Desulfobacteraceae bacterium]
MGASRNADSFQAGQQAARRITAKMGTQDSAGWIMAFCGGRHDPEAVLKGLRTHLGPIPVVGGAAVGTITNRRISYGGYECALAVFPETMDNLLILTVSGLDQNETRAGEQLGKQLKEFAADNATVILFYDSIQSYPPPVLNVGSKLMDGIYAGLADKPLKIFGAGLLSDFYLSRSYVFDGHDPVKNIAVALVLPPVWSSHVTIMHGCTPISAFMEITHIDGTVLYELDGRPAYEVLQEMTHLKMTQLTSEPQDVNFTRMVALGHKLGNPFDPYKESAYINRLIVDTNPKDGSISLFEADFHAGLKIQIMSRNQQLVLDSVRNQTKKLLNGIDDGQGLGALYIDCAGRACAFCGDEVEEASILQEVIGETMPLLGFYSGVELAPCIDRTRPLDWTGVLAVFTMEP